jgi:peptidoglycan/LPS O-acetylase OafA/YrhL
MNKSRISSLDGIRAIAIALVMLMHVGNTRAFPPWNIQRSVGDIGHLGVTIFFVISGYLITTLLINEFNTAGSISLKNFYVRRALRILPAAYVYLLLVAVATYFAWIHVSSTDFFFGATYLINYDAHRSWYVGHLWSLAVEEQFYLLWPILFVWQGRRRALIVATLAFLTAPVVRALMRIMIAPGPYRDLEIFPAVVDAMAIGCAFAILRTWLLAQHLYLKITASHAMWLLPVVVVGINRLNGYTIVDLFGSPVQLLAIAMLIETSTRNAETFVGKMLNAKAVVFVGTLSYSLYLWQQPFLNKHLDSWMTAFPVNLVPSIVAAVCSYYIVERPFLRMRHHYVESKPAAAPYPLA